MDISCLVLPENQPIKLPEDAFGTFNFPQMNTNTTPLLASDESSITNNVIQNQGTDSDIVTPRKTRQRFNINDTVLLSTVFNFERHPKGLLLNILAICLKCSAKRLQIWFQNKRSREKQKQKKKLHAQFK